MPDSPGLRPSGDRLRETLFNWLQPFVGGARCLDLFAGSGALGLEAASRGAAHVTLVEREAAVLDALAASVEVLDAGGRLRLVRAAAIDFLAAAESGPGREPFDIVFVDPPFGDACQEDVLVALARGHLAAGALVHVEAPAAQHWPDALPGGLAVHRERVFGEVVARLLRVS